MANSTSDTTANGQAAIGAVTGAEAGAEAEADRRLVAFVDASVYATSVCDYAAWIAPKAGLNIELVHVIDQQEPPSSNMSGAIGLGARTNLLDRLVRLDSERAKIAQAQGRAILEDATLRIAKRAPKTVVSEALRNGRVVEAVQAIGEHARLIVVGKRGDTRDIDGGLIGTNLEAVVRASAAPVLVANRAFCEPKRFLIAFDGGPSVMRAVEHIAQNNGLEGMEGVVVGVRQAQETDMGLYGKLDAAAERLSLSGKPCRIEWREGQNVENVIVEEVEKNDSDLLVMGAYGHSRIRNLVIGSTTTAMIQRCKVPVLMFR